VVAGGWKLPNVVSPEESELVPIDDPITALQGLNLSDERQRSPVSRFAKPFLEITKLIAGGGVEIPIGGLKAAVDWLSRKAESNLEEFVDVLAADLRYRGAQVQKLLVENEAQRKFVEDELPGLAVDALRRAEQCRAKERIGRLAKILGHAAEVGAQDGPDTVEEMMATATGLSDLEVLVLQLAATEYRKERAAHPQEAQRAVAARAWMRVPGIAKFSVSEDELLSVGAKLESFGLAVRVERQPWETPVYRPLDRGYKFIEYISSAR
jgi:hypothetical protein